MTSKLADIDLFTPIMYEQTGVPHEAFTTLRKESPVYWHQNAGIRPDDGVPHRGFWAVTKYDDIVRISKDPGTFSSARGGTNAEDYHEEDLSQIQILMVNMDPPDHVKFRRLVSMGFTPRMVSKIEPKVREAARNIVDAIIEKGSCDFVRDIAAELPLIVIADLLGVPQEDRQKLFDWSNRLIGFDDPEFQTSIVDAREAAQEIWMYANQLAEDKKGKGGDDFVSVLIAAEIDGEQLDEMQFDAFFLLLAVAGNETTRNLISGAMRALLENPEQWAKLKADPSLVTSATEEFLRWVTPVNYFRRTATKDTEIRGQKIKENDKIVMFYASANRDEDVYKDGQKFDIARTPNDHLAFGIGQHFCLGNGFARLEIRIMFEEIIKRLPDIQMTAKPRQLRSNFINGIKEMPVKFTPGKKLG